MIGAPKHTSPSCINSTAGRMIGCVSIYALRITAQTSVRVGSQAIKSRHVDFKFWVFGGLEPPGKIQHKLSMLRFSYGDVFMFSVSSVFSMFRQHLMFNTWCQHAIFNANSTQVQRLKPWLAQDGPGNYNHAFLRASAPWTPKNPRWENKQNVATGFIHHCKCSNIVKNTISRTTLNSHFDWRRSGWFCRNQNKWKRVEDVEKWSF